MSFLVLREKASKRILMSQVRGSNGTMMRNAKKQPDINIADVEEVRMTEKEYATATNIPDDPQRKRNRISALKKIKKMAGLTDDEMKEVGL